MPTFPRTPAIRRSASATTRRPFVPDAKSGFALVGRTSSGSGIYAYTART